MPRQESILNDYHSLKITDVSVDHEEIDYEMNKLNSEPNKLPTYEQAELSQNEDDSVDLDEGSSTSSDNEDIADEDDKISLPEDVEQLMHKVKTIKLKMEAI